MTAGHSGTPLARNLGIAAGHVLAVLDDPGHLLDLLEPLPGGLTVRRSARGRADVAVYFTRKVAELQRRISSLGRLVYPAGVLWVCWPKKASGVATDVSENAIRDVVLPLGMVDVKVAAIDATWSGLEIVWRGEARSRASG